MRQAVGGEEWGTGEQWEVETDREKEKRGEERRREERKEMENARKGGGARKAVGGEEGKEYRWKQRDKRRGEEKREGRKERRRMFVHVSSLSKARSQEGGERRLVRKKGRIFRWKDREKRSGKKVKERTEARKERGFARQAAGEEAGLCAFDDSAGGRAGGAYGGHVASLSQHPAHRGPLRGRHVRAQHRHPHHPCLSHFPRRGDVHLPLAPPGTKPLPRLWQHGRCSPATPLIQQFHSRIFPFLLFCFIFLLFLFFSPPEVQGPEDPKGKPTFGSSMYTLLTSCLAFLPNLNLVLFFCFRIMISTEALDGVVYGM